MYYRSRLNTVQRRLQYEWLNGCSLYDRLLTLLSACCKQIWVNTHHLKLHINSFIYRRWFQAHLKVELNKYFTELLRFTIMRVSVKYLLYHATQNDLVCIFVNSQIILDFKHSQCSECCMLSSVWFNDVYSLSANDTEHSIPCSTGLWRQNWLSRNLGIQTTDASESPRRKHTTATLLSVSERLSEYNQLI
jgi:hypothetical protein